MAQSERGSGRGAAWAGVLRHRKISQLIKVVDKLPHPCFQAVNPPRAAGCSAKSLPSHFFGTHWLIPGGLALSCCHLRVTICSWISSPFAAPPLALCYQHSKKNKTKQKDYSQQRNSTRMGSEQLPSPPSDPAARRTALGRRKLYISLQGDELAKPSLPTHNPLNSTSNGSTSLAKLLRISSTFSRGHDQLHCWK